MLIRTAVALFLLAALPASATVGEQHRLAHQPTASVRDAAHRPDLRITVWYPAEAGARTRSIDIPPDQPLFRVGEVAADAPFIDEERRPIVLVSHGFGGSARMMGWLGLALAERGYVVVAVDHPGNNGVDPPTAAGSVLWWDRADDLKVALAAILADPQLSPHVDAARVGVAGFSIGGLTALVAGGARTDPVRMIRFCEKHPEDGTCEPQLEFALSNAAAVAALESPALAGERAKAREDHAVPGVKAVFAMAPVVQPLTPASLKAMRTPVVILAGAADRTAPPRTQALVAKSLIRGSKVTILPGVTHYSFLAACSATAVETLPVCHDARAQEGAHRQAIEAALELFDQALGPRPGLAL